MNRTKIKLWIMYILVLGLAILWTFIACENSEMVKEAQRADNSNDEKAYSNNIGIVPIGGIVAWHNYGGSLMLSDEWVKCDGGKINDIESPIYGQEIPNLNGDGSDTSGRFLRGTKGTTGTYQDDAFQGHWHNISSNARTQGGSHGRGPYPSAEKQATIKARNPIDDGTNGTPRTASETRPKNMSVIWIMRIK